MAGAALSAQAGILAGPVYNPANEHSYYLLTEDTWQDSETQAVSLGGHLATINNQAEQDWVFTTFGSYAGTNRSLWIGLREVGTEGNYQWVSGDSVSYTHWLSGQPDNGNVTGPESYVHMINTGNIYGHPGGFWNDLKSPNTVFSTFNPLCGVVEVDAPLASIRVSQVEVSWRSSSNATYQVQYRSDLTTNTWLPLVQCIQGTGTNNYVYDAVLVSQPQRFYRVVLTNCVP